MSDRVPQTDHKKTAWFQTKLDKLPAELRRTTELMAHHAGVSFDIWDDHSRAVLQAADEIEKLRAAIGALERHVALNAMDELVHDERTGAIVGWQKTPALMNLLDNAQKVIGS